MYRKRDKDLEDEIVCGIPLSRAMQMVVGSCNKPDTLYIPEGQLKSSLERLRPLLSDPLTNEQAEILRSIVLKEKPIADVVEWLEQSSGMTWTEFVQNKDEVAEAQNREQQRVRHQELLEAHAKFVEELKTRDRSACPRCRSKDDVIPILYGYPKPYLLLFPEHDQYELGGCCIIPPNIELWRCRKCGLRF
jgi:hypothetical protein